MRYPEEEYISEDSDSWDQEAMEEQQVNAVPVEIINANTERVTPQFANVMTWTIQQFGAAQGSQPPYTQILQKRQNRFKAKMVLSLGTATGVALATSSEKLTGTSAPQSNQAVFLATASGNLPDWESERPLYAVAIGGANATIAIIDESYGQQQ